MTDPDARPPSGPRPPGSPRRPGRRPSGAAPPPVDPERLRAAARRVRTFLLFVVAALVAATLPVPWQLGGLAFVTGAVVAGIRALRAARRSGVREQVTPLVVVGLVFTVLMGLSMGTSLLLWSAETARQECLANAVTIRAREACEARYEADVERRLDELTGRSTD